MVTLSYLETRQDCLGDPTSAVALWFSRLPLPGGWWRCHDRSGSATASHVELTFHAPCAGSPGTCAWGRLERAPDLRDPSVHEPGRVHTVSISVQERSAYSVAAYLDRSFTRSGYRALHVPVTAAEHADIADYALRHVRLSNILTNAEAAGLGGNDQAAAFLEREAGRLLAGREPEQETSWHYRPANEELVEGAHKETVCGQDADRKRCGRCWPCLVLCDSLAVCCCACTQGGTGLYNRMGYYCNIPCGWAGCYTSSQSDEEREPHGAMFCSEFIGHALLLSEAGREALGNYAPGNMSPAVIVESLLKSRKGVRGEILRPRAQVRTN